MAGSHHTRACDAIDVIAAASQLTSQKAAATTMLL